eukprot:1717031-Rhodomonas_salina.2
MPALEGAPAQSPEASLACSSASCRSSHDYDSSADCEARRCRPSSFSMGVKLMSWALAVVLSAAVADGAGHTPVIRVLSPMQSMIHTKVGCDTSVVFSAVDEPFNQTRLWGEFNSSYAFPPHTEVSCSGPYLLKNGFRVCEGAYSLLFKPTTQQTGQTYTVCVNWEAGDAGPGPAPEARAS